MHKVSPPVKAVRCCTGHEPLGSVVVRLFGNAGAQLGKDFLFGFRAGVKLAQALVGLTDIVESGVDTVQFHTFDRCQQQSVHVELGEFAGDVVWLGGPTTGFPVDHGKACGGAGRVKSTDEYRIEFAIDQAHARHVHDDGTLRPRRDALGPR